MRMLDLFSGIGGFSLAAQWVWGEDLEIVGFCENEPYPHKVLKKNFPGVPIHEDITKLDGKEFKNIDLITGGFPCQDISIAGRGAGVKEGMRSGLWFDLLRIIRDVRPRYALIENVPMLTIRGGTRVISDLTEIGYDTEWTIISAKDVGAWHLRKRIWIVAYPECVGRSTGAVVTGKSGNKKASDQPGHSSETQYGSNSKSKRGRSIQGQGWGSEGEVGVGGICQELSNTSSKRLQGAKQFQTHEGEAKTQQSTAKPFEETGNYWSIEPKLGRVAHGVPNRVDRLKGLGNAIVPQVAALIMEMIKKEMNKDGDK